MEHFTKSARAQVLAAIGVSGLAFSISVFALGAVVATADTAFAAKAKPEAPVSEADAKQKAAAAARQSYNAGIKSHADGKYQLVVDQLSSALRVGGLSSAEMAKALYVRGASYKKLDKPGLAISDLTSALWLKNGLGEADQKAAIAERAEAYRMAGLGDGTSGGESVSVADPNPAPAGSKAAAIPAPVPAASVATATAPAAAIAAPAGEITRQSPDSEIARDAANARRIAAQPIEGNGLQAVAMASVVGSSPQVAPLTEPAPAPALTAAPTSPEPVYSVPGMPGTTAPSAPVLSAAPIEGGGLQPSAPVTSASNVPSAIGGFFSNLFSGGSSSAPAPDSATSVTTASTTPPPATSSWSESTSVASGAAKPAKPSKAAQTAAAPATKSGKYKLHIAAVRSRAEAEALAQKLAAQQGSALKNRVPVVDEAVIGSMGTFYRVRVGSYQNAEEPRGVCNTLRSSGFDCLVVTN